MQVGEQLRLDHIQSLVRPEGFEPMVFHFGVAGIERLDPGRKPRNDRAPPSFLEHALGVMPGPVFGSLERFKQFVNGCADEFGTRLLASL